MFVGEQLSGVISIQSVEKERAFSESDVRLLETLANSMSVALESARLFDETQQRNAELAIINSVQASLAAKLDMQAIYDAVGNKIHEIFDAQVVAIVINDKANNLSHFPYIIEKGQRLNVDSSTPGGISGLIFKTGQTILINENIHEREIELLGSSANYATAGELPKSRLDVPMMAGNEVRGVISLQNVDRERAFAESDVRLLQTLANSMSIALENARLFDETQRLLKVTEERAEELAIINSVQQGLASQLDIQAIFDLVGDKIRETFDAQTVMILTHDKPTNLLHFAYMIEKGERLFADPMPMGDKGFAPKVMRTRQPLMINENLTERSVEVGTLIVPGSEPVKSGIWVPLVIGEEARGVLSIQNVDKENAFSDSDFRLKMPASSTRPNACSKKPSNAPPNSPSSTAFNKAWRLNWIFKPSSIWSAIKCAIRSMLKRY
jgi:GAF domain-containing protein